MFHIVLMVLDLEFFWVYPKLYLQITCIYLSLIPHNGDEAVLSTKFLIWGHGILSRPTNLFSCNIPWGLNYFCWMNYQ